MTSRCSGPSRRVARVGYSQPVASICLTIQSSIGDDTGPYGTTQVARSKTKVDVPFSVPATPLSLAAEALQSLRGPAQSPATRAEIQEDGFPVLSQNALGDAPLELDGAVREELSDSTAGFFWVIRVRRTGIARPVHHVTVERMILID